MQNTDQNTIETSIRKIGSAALNESLIKCLYSTVVQQNGTQFIRYFLANYSLGRMLDQTESDILKGLDYCSTTDRKILSL